MGGAANVRELDVVATDAVLLKRVERELINL